MRIQPGQVVSSVTNLLWVKGTQVIHDIEFAPGVAWPVNSRTALLHDISNRATSDRRAKRLAHTDEVLALDMNGELTAIDHDRVRSHH